MASRAPAQLVAPPRHVGSSRTRDRTRVSLSSGGFFTTRPPGMLKHFFFFKSHQNSDTKGQKPQTSWFFFFFFPGQVEREFQPGHTHSSLPPAVWPQGHCLDRLASWLSGDRPACRARDSRDGGSIPGWGRSPGGGHGHPLQYSCLESPRDGGAWWAAVRGVAETRAGLSEHTRCLPTGPI